MSNAIPIYKHSPTIEATSTYGRVGYSSAGQDRVNAQTDLMAIDGIGAQVKRLVDFGSSAIALILLAPVVALIAVLIKLDSKGPILFRQRRLGFQGQAFWCLKFRTMTTDAEQRLEQLESLNESAGGVLFKMRSDPRVTRLGRILRKTSLDELPQFLNVLRGEMSLVGPRPLQLRDCQLLEAMDPEGFQRRLSVPQGLTGAWQVGGRSALDCDGMLKLDIDYAENWSLWLDVKILCRTVYVVLVGRGAC